MRVNQLNKFNRVRYTLFGSVFGAIEIKEPKNWDKDQKELIRSEKYSGITANISNAQLEFYERAKTNLKSEYNIRGIKGDVEIEREIRNANTDEWEIDYSAYLDFPSYSENKNFVKLKLGENKFFKNIENRFKDSFELDRLDDLKGGVLPPLEYKNLSLQGRDIFRKSEFNNNENYFMYRADSDFVVDTFNFPLKLLYKSDENVFEPAIAVSDAGQINNESAYVPEFGGTISHFFYVTADNTREITIQIKGKIYFQRFGTTTLPNPKNIKLRLARYLYDETTGTFSDSIFNDLTPEFSLDITDGLVEKDIDFSVTFDKRLTESFVISCTFPGDIYPLKIDYKNLNIILEETQDAVITECKALTYFQVFERLFWIITGKNNFTSNLLTNEWKDLLYTNGFKIRNIPDKSITTSLDEVWSSLYQYDDIALIIKNNKVSIEKRQLVFDNQNYHDIGVVSDINRELAEKQHYSTIEIGSDFNGLYEEVAGLEEYNIRTSYTTCIDETDNKFTAISKVRTDSYGITLAQEKQYQSFPKLDTKYDKYNFAIDAKQITVDGVTTYYVRHWQDDFANAPTGIYSPNTAFNLRLSPFNSLLRKSKTISTGLQKFPNDLLKYANTEGNSQLVTLYPERANIANSVLSSPYFLPEIITFTKHLTFSQYTEIVKNPYKLIKFVNEKGLDEYAFVWTSIQPKEGKFTLIKANI